DSAPVAYLSAMFTNTTAATQTYLGTSYTTNGISSVTASAAGESGTIIITFKLPSSLGPGVYNDNLKITGCSTQQCTTPYNGSPQTVTVQYTILGEPEELDAVSPTFTSAGVPGFTITATGGNFVSQSVVQWAGSPRATTFVSSTQLTAQITAADVANPVSVPITVVAPEIAASQPVPFNVYAPVALSLTSVSPVVVYAGGPATMLTLTGTGFNTTSTVQLNGAGVATALVSATELQAMIPASAIANPGSIAVSVLNGAAPSGTAGPLTVNIRTQLPDAVALQITPAHSGVINFPSANLPAGSLWSVSVGGPPSYALIADGNVYVTVAAGSGVSELLALNQATGATVWGPIALAGNTNAAYESGKVFVVSSGSGAGGVMQAFDAGSGAALWSSQLIGQLDADSGVTALNGLVYSAGTGVGGTLYAFDESSGNLVWTQQVSNGDDSAPAVLPDGVYVSYPCNSYDFQPTTGALNWYNNSGCDGGGGGTPVVANGVFYSPNGSGTSSGTVFNAETGAQVGAYAADNPPAIGAQMGYFLQGGTLRALTLSSGTIAWSFAGDGGLVSSPIQVNQYVFVGSSSGNLYGLDATSGVQLWQVNVGAAIPAGTVWSKNIPLSGLSAGDGLLVVPAGNSVTAFSLSTTVVMPPLLTAVSPNFTAAGVPAFSITATGGGFTSQSTVQWGGSARPTTFVNATELTAQINAADVASPASTSITVTTPGSGTSTAIAFNVVAPTPLALTSLAPASTTAGGAAFNLLISGTGFNTTSAVQLNGVAVSTLLVSPTTLQALVPATAIATPGPISVSVVNTAAPSGTAGPLTLTVGARSVDAVSFQITAAHSGAIQFQSASLPTTSRWSVNVGGAPSYAVIADGNVYITVPLSGGVSELLALNQTTGATVWGPVEVSGSVNAAYDSGRIFVVSSGNGSGGFVQAFDAGNGTSLWTSQLVGQLFADSGIAALNGYVYTAGTESGGDLYAFSESSGALIWTEAVANGDDSTPAVTNDGVYVSYPCNSYDFQPVTGAQIWANATGCDGGGGGTPVVANGLFYSPNGAGTYNGQVFNAATGALAGAYIADNPPAIGTQMGYFLQSGTLRAITLSSGVLGWSFAGDGHLVTSPILVNQYVFVGSASGNLYGLDAATGAQVWQVNVGAAIPPGAGWLVGIPLSGLAAGDGLLVVPAGNTVTAYTLSTNP
ncbi:MAG TPA: PQQ-binding-like beta-propeller repeat protein, partial [Steroidobacteraceae bacterium]